MGFADLPPFKDPPTRPLAHDVKRPQLQSPDRWSTEKIILKFITHYYSTKEIHAKGLTSQDRLHRLIVLNQIQKLLSQENAALKRPRLGIRIGNATTAKLLRQTFIDQQPFHTHPLFLWNMKVKLNGRLSLIKVEFYFHSKSRNIII